MCSLTIACVLLLKHVFSYYSMCSLTIACVLLLKHVFSYYRMCSLTIECVLLLQLTAKKEDFTVLLGQRDALQAAVDKREVTVRVT